MNRKLYKYEWFVFLLYNRERLLCLYKNKLDITGRILEVKDALGRTATTNVYALSEKHLLSVYNIDSGTRWILNDTAGKPVKKWDSINNEFTFSYDELQRPTETVVNGVCTEKLVYGDDALQNNIGQVIESYAQDGKTSFEYDFKGNVIKQTKWFAEDYDTQLDWNGQVGLLVTDGTFVTETTYDALNRPKSIKQPDETILFYGYDKGGLLNNVKRGNEEHILDIKYNAKGQRKHIYYGNNTKTRYYYHKKNFRLMRILTTKNTGQEVMQDLNYEFDTVGNIIKITDNAQTTQYFGNQIIEPVSTYKYDALYRLIKATGREKDGLQMPTHKDFENDILCTDVKAIHNYTQKFQYDALGNMLQMKSKDRWTRDYFYDTGTNRLLRHNSTQTTDEYEYDTHGNMTKMPHLSTILWNEKDEMTSATNGTFVSYYNYDVQGNRSRKVVVKDNVTETRYYVGGFEVFRKETSNVLDFERKTLNISDDEKVFVRVETSTNTTNIRYQYDNHLGSACLELDNAGAIISYEEYHAFGSTSYKSGRSETEVSQRRYKYNGKERDEETGLYYYGARYYAAWLGRFTACDPKQFDYPQHAAYVYCADNPLKFIDPDGKDFRVGIYQDDKGSWHLDISSTIHVFSDKGDAASKVEEYNKFIQDNINEFTKSYTSEDGTEFTVSININYVEGEKNKKGKIINYKDGDNELNLKGGVERHIDMGAVGTDNTATGREVVMNNDANTYGQYYSSAVAVLHDILHVMGLGDRYYNPNYDDVTTPVEGFEEDIMGYEGISLVYFGLSELQINQIHFDNYGKAFIPPAISDIETGTTISNKRVDCATIREPLCPNKME